MGEIFNAENALRPLKHFQRATVEYVSARLLTDPDSVRHFLVADEVGLGKTMVARGVIARTIEALQHTVPRIDVVYICSNGAIAKQNVSRLNVMGGERTRVLPTRLTMLALELARAGGINSEGVNFFSLTPGTSLDLKQGGGTKQERALILRLIWPLLEDRRAVAKMLQGYAGPHGWRSTRKWIDAQRIEPQIEDRFLAAVQKRPALLSDLEDCAQAYKGLRHKDTDLNRRREALVGEFRTILARESAEALEPDLIVLDEFQRFTELLHGDSEAAELAQKLFDAVDPDGNQAKVLLLSATPYKMLSLRDDEADSGDHYAEFLDVLGFLFGAEHGEQVRAELEKEMRRFRSAMQSLPASFDKALEVKTGIEATLRRVISRTERVSETEDRDAMMRDVKVPVTVEAQDLMEARAVARVADAAEAPNTVEYWKSAPYLLSFLREYKLGQKLEEQKDTPSPQLLSAIRDASSAQIDPKAVETYQPIPENNGRIRALKSIAFRDDMARRLWMPPSLPYFGSRILASKVLIFSQWAMVPDAIAALLSYESERAMGMAKLGRGYSARHPQLLSFRRSKDRLTGLRVLPLVVASPTLARTVDPLKIFCSGRKLQSSKEMREAVRSALLPFARRITGWLRPAHRSGLHEQASPGPRFEFGQDIYSDRAETWDWACAAAMDFEQEGFADWISNDGHFGDLIREDGQVAWLDHLSALRDAAGSFDLHGNPDQERLLDHLCDLALGSPATCALRSLSRVAPDLPLDDPDILSAATRIGMAFRSLFNQPESQALLRGETDEVYWQSVLHYCVEYDLQSVMDEYVHSLLEAEGLADTEPGAAVGILSEAVEDAISLKPAQIDIKSYTAHTNRIDVQRALTMRGRFATRLLQKGQEEGVVQRTDTVRSAFNSPFRPFVLASTSVGQEGLDFHPYCHRLVHWNLPSNPVDLEQREGRIHRFKNHAVRLNLAERYAYALKEREISDPWRFMFSVAHKHASRPGDLEPFWLLDGTTSIERYVLSLPFSRETNLLSWLKRSVALYRLAFGQPRQDDLLSFLERADRTFDDLDLSALQISLRPGQK